MLSALTEVWRLISACPDDPGEGTILVVMLCLSEQAQESYRKGSGTCSSQMELVTTRGVCFASGETTGPGVFPTLQLASSLNSFLFKINLLILFIYFWLCWVFVAAHGLSLVAASRGYSSLRCAGSSLWWLLLLWSMGSRREGFSSCGMWAQ